MKKFLAFLIYGIVNAAHAECPTTLSGKFVGSTAYTQYDGFNAVQTRAGDAIVTINGATKTYALSERGKVFGTGELYSGTSSGKFSYSTSTCRGTATSTTGMVWALVISNSGNLITLTYYTEGSFNLLGSFVLTRI